MTDASNRRRGRRPGHSDSRETILEAARHLFAERGYTGATVRAIAARAHVDPALIAYFFGDKNRLFVVVTDPVDQVSTALLAALAERTDDLAARLTRLYLHCWEEPDTGDPLLATTRSASTHEVAMRRLRAHLPPAVPSDAGPSPTVYDTDLGIALAMSHLHGIAIARHIIKMPGLTGPSLTELTDAVAPTIQHYLTGRLPEMTQL